MPTSEERCTVCVRIRPLNERETAANGAKAWHTLPEHQAVQRCDVNGNPILNDKNAVFQYDHVFGEDSSTGEMFRSMGSGLVDQVLRGVNGTIFAYGQTSSGKTFTMQNPSEGTDMGLVQCATDHIFNHIAEHSERQFYIRISFLEVYNEQVYDLLHEKKDKTLQIHEDTVKGVHVQAYEHIVAATADLSSALRFGQRRRNVAATKMNERSSRSHTIFRITIESQLQSEDGEEAAVVATLNLVDLAGSENARLTGATGKKLKEGSNINKSLTTLSRVIMLLGDDSKYIVPYRESKLTRLLQPYLSGGARIAVICCISPSAQFCEETRSTLQFGQRAKQIKTNAIINEVRDDARELKRVKRELTERNKELSKQRDSIQNAFDHLLEQNYKLEERNEKLELVKWTQYMLERVVAMKKERDALRLENRELKETLVQKDFV